jgi:site-specific DNA-methyltransferase (adenine-specific)
VLKGYYKAVGGEITENIARGKSQNIRAGNVWLDIQQVFYRMEENVAGCYAQKPLKSIERIVTASSAPGATVADFFSHSGTTLIAGEKLGRRVIAADLDPVYAEITIRRLERLRSAGKTGWQWESPFPELGDALTVKREAAE